MPRKPTLCPRCRNLIGSQEQTCSRCGTARGAFWWRLFSGTADAREGEWLVGGVITLTLVYYAVSLLVGFRLGQGGFLAPGRLSLLWLGATGSVPVEQLGRFWSLISATYLHGGVLHLLFNLMALHQIGPRVVTEYGPCRMVVIYTLGGVFGFWVSCRAGVPFTIGASAAICGLIGSLLYFGKSHGGSYGAVVYREVSGWVISLGIFGLIVPGINNWAHGGGILGGILLGMLLGYNGRGRENSLHLVLALVCAGVTLAVLGWAVLGVMLLGPQVGRP